MTASEAERWRFGRHRRPAGRSVAVAATGVVAVALGVRFVASVAVNAPGGPSAVPTGLLGAGVTGLAGLAAVAVGASEDDALVGIGPLFVGVFGLLAAFVDSVAVPAAVAVVAGTAVLAFAAREDLSTARALAAALLVAALGVSLAGGLGPASLRPAGSTLALLAVATTPVFAATDARALVGGAAAFGVVLGFGLARPFVTGAVTLVGGGVVGASLPVVALAVAGAVTTASAALRTRRLPLLAGVALLALAGVPAELSRAVPFALGIVVLLAQEVRG